MEINILGLIIILAFIASAIDGYKKGLVEGVIKIVSTIIGVGVLIILVKGIGDFMEKSYVKVALALILLMVVNVVDRIIKLILNSLKLITKLPIVSWLNKMAGMVFGVAQMLFTVWVLLTLVSIFQIPQIDAWVYPQVEASRFLTWIYENNSIAHILEIYRI